MGERYKKLDEFKDEIIYLMRNPKDSVYYPIELYSHSAEEGINIVSTYNLEKGLNKVINRKNLPNLKQLYENNKIDFSIVGGELTTDIRNIKMKIDDNPDRKIVIPHFTGIYYVYKSDDFKFPVFFEKIAEDVNGMLIISNEIERKDKQIPDIGASPIVDIVLKYPDKDEKCEIIREF